MEGMRASLESQMEIEKKLLRGVESIYLIEKQERRWAAAGIAQAAEDERDESRFVPVRE